MLSIVKLSQAPCHSSITRLPSDPLKIFVLTTPRAPREMFRASPKQIQAVARENRLSTTKIDQLMLPGDPIHKHAIGRMSLSAGHQESVHDAFAEANWYGYYTIRDHVFTADILRSPSEYSKYHKHILRFITAMKIPVVLHPLGEEIDLIPENMDVLTDAPIEYITEHVF